MPSAETYPQATPQFDRRESIWSVNERWRWLYFTFFLLLMGAGSALVFWREAFGPGAGGGVIESLGDFLIGEATGSVASAGMSLWITEVVMLSTMIGRKLDERKARILREGRQEGRREGRAARDAEWRAWYERMRAAQARGEEFTEPPPSLRARDANGASRANGA